MVINEIKRMILSLNGVQINFFFSNVIKTAIVLKRLRVMALWLKKPKMIVKNEYKTYILWLRQFYSINKKLLLD